MSITAEQIAQLDESDIKALHDVPGLTDGDRQLLGSALELKRPKAAPAPSTTVPLTPERKAKVNEQISRSSLPERPGFAGNLWQGVKDQAAGSLSAFTAHGIPLLSPAVTALTENTGEALGTAFPSIRQHMPQPGDAERRIANAPIPELAETAGQAVMPGAAGAAELAQGVRAIPGFKGMADAASGAADRIAKVGKGAQEPIEQIYNGLAGKAPGGLRTLAAGAGTGVAIGAGEGALRAAPELVDPNVNTLPRSVGEAGQQLVGAASELGPASAMGALTSAPGALASASQKPNTIVGARAIRYARDRSSGAYKTGDLAGLFPGKDGVAQANELGKSRIGTAERQAKMDFEDQMPALEQPIRTSERRAMEDLDQQQVATKGAAERTRGEIAAQVEPEVAGKIQERRKQASDELQSALDSAEVRGQKFNPQALYDDIRGIVEKSAKQESVGSGQEVHTPYGQRLLGIEDMAKKYLGGAATVRDYRNFIKELKSKADSGTPEMSFPYKEILGATREHLGQQDPAVGQAVAKYRTDTSQTERLTGMLYNEDDLHNLGTNEANRHDAPETGESPTPTEFTPKQQAAGRKRLMSLGSPDPTRIPEREELIKGGFGDQVNTMEEVLADVDRLQGLTEAEHADQKAQVEADVSRQVLELKRQLRGQVEEPVGEAKTAADELNLSKLSQEASRFPGISKLVHPMLIGSLGLTSHSAPHGASLVGLSANSVAGTIAQPFASRAAYYSPDPATAQANIPGLMGMVSAADAARERIARGASGAASTAKDLVDGARAQGNRLKERAKRIIAPKE